MTEYVVVRNPPPNSPSTLLSEYPFYLDGSTVRQVGVSGPNTTFQVVDAGDWRNELVAFLDRKHGSHQWDLVETMQPGAYHPRIARLVRTAVMGSSISLERSDKTTAATVVAGAQGQLASLLEVAHHVLSVVDPQPVNFPAYGHAIRNLLILACTEVEAQWKGIMTANGYTPAGRFSTNDYGKLEPAMKLSSFEVVFSYFPSLASFRPFAGWLGSTSPTKDLGWYDDYNAVKHDREGNFYQATLESALNAIAACAVMLVAQFGTDALTRPDLRAFFRMVNLPAWGPGEAYIRAFPNSGSPGPVMCSF